MLNKFIFYKGLLYKPVKVFLDKSRQIRINKILNANVGQKFKIKYWLKPIGYDTDNWLDSKATTWTTRQLSGICYNYWDSKQARQDAGDPI